MSSLSFQAGAHASAIGAATDRGHKRAENEDALTVAANGRLVAVADGMGGHARGAWAAHAICRALEQVALPDDPAIARDAVAAALAAVNDRIANEGLRGGGVIGSTVVALVHDGARYACLWAGDSRAYLVRDGMARQITRDHSQVEELVAAGVLARERARDHPLGNVVTRSVGVARGLALDMVEDAIRPGDRFLLCSDGLTRVMQDEEIAAAVLRLPPDLACHALIQAVLERGAPDNVSVIVVAPAARDDRRPAAMLTA